jgi:hypothetical protein
MKNKTLATWLALVLGPFGLHRLYLFGWKDGFVWAHFFLTLLGLLGLHRLTEFGVDDPLSWWLLPLLGFSMAWNCLEALMYGLTNPEQWNRRFNPGEPETAHPGFTNWLTVIAIVLSLMVGTTSLLSGLVMSFQHYFEAQVQEGLKLAE